MHAAHDIILQRFHDSDGGIHSRLAAVLTASLRFTTASLSAVLAARQETEDLALDEKVTFAGVEAVLRDPAKGCYFVATVRTAAATSACSIPARSQHLCHVTDR